jgi:hypothetical protein
VDGEVKENAKEVLDGFLSCPHKDNSAAWAVGGGGLNTFLYGAQYDISYYEISITIISLCPCVTVSPSSQTLRCSVPGGKLHNKHEYMQQLC